MARALLNDQLIELVARRFRMLGEPQRLRILQSLQAGEKTVNEIVGALKGNQPNVSRHLQALFDAGLVDRRRAGNNIYYSIADPVIPKLCDLVCQSALQDARAKLVMIAGDEPGAAGRK
jgi:DNA-binding transcriptional ArsR family regulator